MWRFIVCSFAFMGWGFYELSGGSDFSPETQQASIFAPVIETAPSEVEQTDTVQIATASDEDANIILASVSTRAEPLQPLDTAALASLVEPAKAEVLVEPVTPEVTAPIEVSAPALDLRTVKPARVNVRGGPSTEFNVVAKLRQSDTVTILFDDGNGWVEIETVDGQIGWMADFLLVASN